MKNILIGFSSESIILDKERHINLPSIINRKQKVFSIKEEKYSCIPKRKINIIEWVKK